MSMLNTCIEQGLSHPESWGLRTPPVFAALCLAAENNAVISTYGNPNRPDNNVQTQIATNQQLIVNGTFGLRLYSTGSNTNFARMGFDYQFSTGRLNINHTPQGENSAHLSKAEQRLFSKFPDFRVLMLRDLIQVAGLLHVDLTATGALNHHKVITNAVPLPRFFPGNYITTQRAQQIIDDPLQEAGFTLQPDGNWLYPCSH